MVNKDATISWIRFTGKSRFRSLAMQGDTVVQIYKSLSGKRTTVFEPCPIVLPPQNISHWTRFYVSEPADFQHLSWNKFRKEAKKIGLSNISKNSVRELNNREVLLIEVLWR